MPQGSFFRVRATFGFEDARRGWTVGPTGDNLTNEYTSIREDRIIGVRATFPEPRRAFYGQFRWTF